MIWNKMKEELKRLPRAQKCVARYVLDNPSESLFMTSQQLGQNSGTSEATVIRLATALGFAGFPEFKEALQQEAKDQLLTFGRFKENRPADYGVNLLSAEIAEEMERASPLFRNSNDGNIRRLASWIIDADAIFLLGFRSARSLAVYLQFYLSWFLPNVSVPEGDSFDSRLASASANTLAIGISFQRYTRLTVDCIQLASKRGLRTAALTDSTNNPLSRAAGFAVVVPCVHIAHLDSLVIPLAMANAILIEVARQLGEGALARLSELEGIWEDGSVYI